MDLPTDNTFFVVYEYTEAAGAYAGNRFRTPFDSVEQYAETPVPPNTIVVATGVSEAESLQLCEAVSLITQARAVMADVGYGTPSFDPDLARLTTAFLWSARHNPRE